MRVKNIIMAIFLTMNFSLFAYINLYPTQIVETQINDINKEINLYNGSSKPRKYHIYFEKDSTIEKWSDVSPKSVTLLPEENKKIKLKINLPKTQNNERYMGILVFKEITNTNISTSEEQGVFTEYRMPVIIYSGTKGAMTLPVAEIGNGNIEFFDIKGNQIVYTINGKSYVKNLDNNTETQELKYKVIDRLVNYYLIELNGKKAIVSLDLSTPYLTDVDNIEQSGDPSIFAIQKNGKYALMKLNSLLTPFEYDYIGKFKGEYSLFAKNGKFGILQNNGKEIVPAKADEVYFSKNGNWIAKIDGKYQTSKFDMNVEKIIPTFGNYPVYEKDGKFGLIDIEKMKMIDCKFDEINPNIDHGILVSNGTKYGITKVADLELNKEIDYKYDLVSQSGGDTFGIVSIKSGKYSYYNVYSGLLTSDIYDDILPKKNLFFAIRGKEADVYNKYGKYVATVNEEKLVYLGDNFIIQKLDNIYEIIDIRDV